MVVIDMKKVLKESKIRNQSNTVYFCNPIKEFKKCTETITS